MSGFSLFLDLSEPRVVLPVVLGHRRQEDQCHKPQEPHRHDTRANYRQELVDGQKQ